MKEINLIGGFYLSKSRPWSSQDLVNWIPVKSVAGGTRSPFRLRGLPGLIPMFVAPTPPPPLGDTLTSTVYPIEAIEEINSAASVAGGNLSMAGAYGYVEAMDSGATVSGGSLRVLLREYTYAEAVDSTATLASGSLRVILKSYEYTEALDSTATLSNGALRAILIDYQNYPAEAIDSTATITGGALA